MPALAGRDEEAVLPILRHQDQDLYYRERFDTLGIGYYGHRPMPIRAQDIARLDASEVMPSVLEFTQEDFEEAWRQTQLLLPSTRDAKIEEGINGLFSFTTDNMPLIGQSPDVSGFWVAEAVWVTHSAGVGRAVAELARGRALLELRPARVRREPVRAAPALAAVRRSPATARTSSRSTTSCTRCSRPRTCARCGPARSTSASASSAPCSSRRPAGSARSGTPPTPGCVDGRDIPTPNDWAARYWSPIVAAEAQVTREAVAMYDMTALKRLEVTGRGAAAFLNGLVTGNVDKSVGSVTYCLLLDVDGGIRSDVTVARLGASTGSRSAPTATSTSTGSAATCRRTARCRSATSRRAPAASGCGDRAPATCSSR